MRYTLNLYLLERLTVCWVFPEPVFTPGTILRYGVHARLLGKPDWQVMFPLEPLVQGRKHISVRLGDATQVL